MIYNELLTFPGVTYPLPGKPASITSQNSYIQAPNKNDIPAPHSALAILGTNREIYTEASSIFYHQNDLIFSYPTHLENFLLGLTTSDRLHSIRSLTLFYKEDGDLVLMFLSCLRGLKKFHLLFEDDLEALIPQGANRGLAPTSFAPLPSVSRLFDLRGLTDIRVRDLRLEQDAVKFTTLLALRDAERKVQALRYFNHGLGLAQRGVVDSGLRDGEEDWSLLEEWPGLLEGTTTRCVVRVGCACGTK
jgi:hypothetical protein